MNFASDNVYGAHPAVMAGLIDCNGGAVMGYGADPITARAEAIVREVLEAPEAVVRFVATGTAANALLCAQLSPVYGRIYCHEDAHIESSECGAPEFYSGGAKLICLNGETGKLRPDALAQAMMHGEAEGMGGGQNALVSITNATEWGTVYTVDEVTAIGNVSQAAGLKLHMDGARFANAAAYLRCSAADLTWRAGVDALSFGGTKNGALSVEAAVIFDPDNAAGFDFRRKQSGHVISKQRFLAAQMLALLEGGLWLDLARRANELAAQLAEGVQAAGGTLLAPIQSNAVFAAIPADSHARARAAGAIYRLWPDEFAEGRDNSVPIRLVASWDTSERDVECFIAAL